LYWKCISWCVTFNELKCTVKQLKKPIYMPYVQMTVHLWQILVASHPYLFTNIQVWSYLAQFFVEWKMFQSNFCREHQNTHFVFGNHYYYYYYYFIYLFIFENPTVHEIMWKNIVDPERLQATIWRMQIACWIPKATDAHSECVILIAFPRQQWLHERAWMLCYTYIVYLLFHFDIYFHELSVNYNKNYLHLFTHCVCKYWKITPL